MSYRYAQICKHEDGFGYVESDSCLSGEVIFDNMVRLSEDFDLTNKRWNYATSEWETYEPEPISSSESIPVQKPTQLDRIEQAVNLKNEDITNTAVDNYTMELMEEGVL